MALAVESPARCDLSFRTNDDKVFGVIWLKSDAVTPVAVSAATMTLQFDLPRQVWVDGVPVPQPDPTRHTIDSTDPADPDGYIWADGLAHGQVLVQVPRTIWATIVERSGKWDLVATSTDALDRALARGVFVVEEGVST